MQIEESVCCLCSGISAFRPSDTSDLALRSKLSNLYTRDENLNDFWVKYFRTVYYPAAYSQEGRFTMKNMVGKMELFLFAAILRVECFVGVNLRADFL